MSQKEVVFRSKRRKHVIKKKGMAIKFRNFVYRTSDPEEQAVLRARAEEPNSPIREMKPGEKIEVVIKEDPAVRPNSKKVNPEDLDIPALEELKEKAKAKEAEKADSDTKGSKKKA